MKGFVRTITSIFAASIFFGSCNPGSIIDSSSTPLPSPIITKENFSTSIPTISPTEAPSPTHAPTFTSTPEVGGIGVSRSEIQFAYEELGLVFDPPAVISGYLTVRGKILGPDGTIVNVYLIGLENNLREARVALLQPAALATIPSLAPDIRGKIFFVMQVLLDVVYPDWKDSSYWLDESFSSFGDVTDREASVEIEQKNNIVVFEVGIVESESYDYLGIGLSIQSK